MQIRLFALLTSLLLALPGIAYPSGKTSVVVFGPHGGGPQDAEFLRAISGELIAGFMESDLLPLHGAELNERLDSVRDILPERVFLSPVRDAVRSGQRLYRDAQPEEAAALLRAAVPQLEAGRSFLRSPQLAVDLYLNLGLVELNLGNSAAAESAFAQVVRMDPGRVLDDLNYSPRIVATFSGVRDRVLGARSASLKVDPGVPARAYLNGRLLGPTPIVVDRLPAGRHLLVVDGGTEGLATLEVALEENQQAAPVLQLKPGSLYFDDESFAKSGDPLVRALYRQVGLASGADLVAISHFDPAGDFHIALYSSRSDSFSQGVSATLSAAPGSRAEYISGLVRRVAAEADLDGNIKPDRLAFGSPSVRLRDSAGLDALLWPRAAAAPVEAPAGLVSTGPKRSGPPPKKVLAVVGSILGGSLAAVGLGFGIDAAVKRANDHQPTGVLVITVP